MSRRITVRHLGRVEYQDGLNLQAAFASRHLSGEGEDTLLQPQALSTLGVEDLCNKPEIWFYSSLPFARAGG